MHVEKQLLEPYMLEPVEHKVSLYVKPEERQPSNLSRDRISHSTNCSVTTFPQFRHNFSPVPSSVTKLFGLHTSAKKKKES